MAFILSLLFFGVSSGFLSENPILLGFSTLLPRIGNIVAVQGPYIEIEVNWLILELGREQRSISQTVDTDSNIGAVQYAMFFFLHLFVVLFLCFAVVWVFCFCFVLPGCFLHWFFSSCPNWDTNLKALVGHYKISIHSVFWDSGNFTQYIEWVTMMTVITS